MGGGARCNALHGLSSLRSSSTADNDDITAIVPLPKRYPPVGFKNLGNTCYANAALQCLMSTALAQALVEPKCIGVFKKYSSNSHLLESCKTFSSSLGCYSSTSSRSVSDDKVKVQHKKKINGKHHRSDTCKWLTEELTVLCKKYTADPSKASEASSFLSFRFASNSTVIDPGNITRNVNKLSRCLRRGRQEDAHEFLRALLTNLAMDGHNKQLSSLFDGLLESAVTCQTCGNCSITRDRYMDLSLEISCPNVHSLVDALKMFTKAEILSGDNLVDCSKCEKRRVVCKGLRLATAPTILVCHLKRFAFNKYGDLIRLSKFLEFPLELDIHDFMSHANRSTPPPYELVGVLVHHGRSCGSGHYLAYVKSEGEWYRASDSEITRVDVKTVLLQNAYILMYEVEGMRTNKLRLRNSVSNSTSKSRDELSCVSHSDMVQSFAATSLHKNDKSNMKHWISDFRNEILCPPYNNSATMSSILSVLPLCAVVEQCFWIKSTGSTENYVVDDNLNYYLPLRDPVDNKVHEPKKKDKLRSKEVGKNNIVSKSTMTKRATRRRYSLSNRSSSGNLKECMEEASVAYLENREGNSRRRFRKCNKHRRCNSEKRVERITRSSIYFPPNIGHIHRRPPPYNNKYNGFSE